MIFAHVKWFSDPQIPQSLSNVTYDEFFVIVVATIVGLFFLRYIDQQLKEQGFQKWANQKFYFLQKFVPLLVRISLATVLIAGSTSGQFIAPNITGAGTAYDIISISGSILGVLILAGLFTRLSAATVLVIYIASFSVFGLENMIDHLEIAGLAGFLIIEGGGYLSFDRYKLKELKKLSKYSKYSLPLIRTATGLGLVILAFSEKFLNISMASSFLDEYNWNVLSVFGADDRLFILIAGFFELLIGLGLIFNYAPRLLTLGVLMLFITTAILLGPDEIIGHAFALGVVAAIWSNYGIKPKLKKGKK